MFLDRKLARVYIECKSAKWNSPSRQLFPRTSDWKHQKLSNNVANAQGRIAESEELVGSSENNDEDCGENPGSESLEVISVM